MSVLLQKGLGWTDGLISAEKEGRESEGAGENHCHVRFASVLRVQLFWKSIRNGASAGSSGASSAVPEDVTVTRSLSSLSFLTLAGAVAGARSAP